MRLAAVLAALLTLIPGRAGVDTRADGEWSLVLLFDVSFSMRLGPRESEALLAAVEKGLVARLRPEDRVRIGTFASEIRLPPAGNDLQDVMGVLRQSLTDDPEWRYGTSRLWDAIDAATADISTDSGYRVVVVVTDGAATGNEFTRADIAARLKERGVHLWMVHIVFSFGDERLRPFVTEMGGRVFDGNPGRKPDPSRTALSRALADVLEALRALGGNGRSESPLALSQDCQRIRVEIVWRRVRSRIPTNG